MSGESTSSTLTGWLNSQVISRVIAPYAIDPNPAQLHVRVEMLPPATKVHAFSTITKDTALSGTITEANGLANTAYDTANATATVAEVGILRQFTKLGERTNLLGPDGLHRAALEDGVKMCLEKFETDCWAQFANASTSAGVSGSTFKVSDVASALGQLLINKAKGNPVALLPATASKNLRADVVSNAAGIFAAGAGNNLLARTGDDGYMGDFMNVPFYTNNLAATSGADKVGAFMIDGNGSNPSEWCSTGASVGWMPEPAQWSNPVFSGGMQMAITMAYGLVEVIDYAYVKITTIA